MIEDFDDDVINLVLEISDILADHIKVISDEETMYGVLDKVAAAIQEFKND